MMKLFRPAIFLSLVIASTSMAQANSKVSPNLPAFGASSKATSVSGLSSGAFMAVQYQVAFSSSVVGAGVVAGGPYYCAAGSLLNAAVCMGLVPFVPPNPAGMLVAAQGFALAGQIDPLSDLQNDRIYVFSGTKDTVVYQQAVDATVAFFKDLGVPQANLLYVNNMPSGHALITPAFGNACDANAAPYISHCSVKHKAYDQPGAMLTHIYGAMQPPAKKRSGSLISFNQSEFSDASTGMAADAYAYVPQNCKQGDACRVHVAFHGCLQSAAVVQDDFYGKSSYNDWADTNSIIVLYPQVNASTIPYNPKGCWDWFGYTGPNYALQSGSQLKAVRAMVQRLTAPLTKVVASQ
ncbi:depolymerase [Undibacterium piscinae]|uniref:Depolymerase n=2 Tax=Undibacterium TaxID=401469 RepID=A0A6M4A3M1_9BURK|nr:depolymerase [Undibacterium piscinae]